MKLSPLSSLAALLAISAVACASGTTETGSASSASTDQQEIVGGTAAAEGAWPGTVAVYIGSSQGCGGSLIAPEWVITAAHCVTRTSAENGGIDKIVAKTLKLSAGGESIKVKKAWRHEAYNSSTYANDIALLQLVSPSTETPVKFLPASAVEETLVTDASLTVVGWGTTRSGGFGGSDALLQVDVPYVANDKCKTFSGYSKLTDTQFCAGYDTAGKDSCQGDSGGPIFIKQGNETFQAGLVSWGIGCARANQPGVYTRVSQYFDWVKTTSGGAVDLTPAPAPNNGNNGNNGNGTNSEPPANDEPTDNDGTTTNG